MVTLTALASAEAARRVRSAEMARQQRTAAEFEQYYARREGVLTGRLSDQRATTVWLAEEFLPVAVARLQKGETASEILQSLSLGAHLDDEFVEALQAAARTLLEAVQAEEDTRDSAQRAFVSIARRVQAIVHQLGKDLRDMQTLHGNDVVVSRGLQNVDHRNALIGRLAANIAVLGDARPGRQWTKDIRLYEILRGAMARIVDYPRVKLQSVTEVAVVGQGAEPLIHLLAELLDNATTFSPPNTPVEVSASEVPSGIAIEIEDRGVGLTDEVRQRNARVMSQASSGIELADLGEIPQLGLPVVSRLARQSGFDVDLRTSAYGGVRAVVLVPRRLITTAEAPTVPRLAPPTLPGPTLPRPADPPSVTGPAVPRPSVTGPAVPRSTVTGPTMNGDAADKPVEVQSTVNGLPQRRRRSPVPTPVVRTTPQPPSTPSGAAGTTRQPGLMWEAFNGDRPDADLPSRSSDPSDKGE
ncbi:ATP-binding protein [Streptomyces sp. 8N706]|uniref:ATP-binding protein n=1 Tax=Streptomyces sp. 8N706 TaxID=3457416 RepID=UPI003FD65A4B